MMMLLLINHVCSTTCYLQAGLPKGVLNVVHGSHDVVNQILDHPDIKVSQRPANMPMSLMPLGWLPQSFITIMHRHSLSNADEAQLNINVSYVFLFQAVSFVGSNAAGRYIYARGAAAGKRVQSNLGAKNHAVIMPDADVDSTVKALTGAAFGAAGQRCMAISAAVFVGGSGQWKEHMIAAAKSLRVNAGMPRSWCAC